MSSNGERTRTVAVRLTPAEHEAWLVAAAAAGRGRLGAWTRDQVAASLAAGADLDGRRPLVGVGAGMLAAGQVRAQLTAVGSLLNEVVRLSQRGVLDGAAAEDLIAQVAATREVLASVHADLGTMA